MRAVLVLEHRESPESSGLGARGARLDPVSDGLTSRRICLPSSCFDLANGFKRRAKILKREIQMVTFAALKATTIWGVLNIFEVKNIPRTLTKLWTHVSFSLLEIDFIYCIPVSKYVKKLPNQIKTSSHRLKSAKSGPENPRLLGFPETKNLRMEVDQDPEVPSSSSCAKNEKKRYCDFVT